MAVDSGIGSNFALKETGMGEKRIAVVTGAASGINLGDFVWSKSAIKHSEFINQSAKITFNYRKKLNPDLSRKSLEGTMLL